MDGGLWMNSTRPPVSDEVLPSPDLNDREHRKDHLSGETDRSGERSVGGKLIHERSTEHGTQPDLSHRKATKPISDRAGIVRLKWSRSTHQRQTNQLAASIMGTSAITAVVSPRRERS